MGKTAEVSLPICIGPFANLTFAHNINLSHCFTTKSATVHLVVVVVDGVVETLPPHRVPARRVEEPAMPQSPHHHLLEEQNDLSDALGSTGHFDWITHRCRGKDQERRFLHP